MKYANRIGYSDIEPFEIVREVTDKTMEVRRMSYERDPSWKPEMIAGGFAAHCVNQQEQKWFIKSQPAAPVVRIRLHKDGKWRNKFGDVFRPSLKPQRFYDYNF